MITNFTILSGITVPTTYSWDQGTPLTGSNITQIPFDSTTQTSITGYAPGFKVLFKNNSVSDENFNLINYDWNFGDYYNSSSNNISLTCNTPVEHTFLMPGTYTVTLHHRQARNIQSFDYVANSDYCKDKYDFRWFWDNMTSLSGDILTWDQTLCTGKYAKWWDNELACFQKYCKFWDWYNLSQDIYPGANPITWRQTYTDRVYSKKWAFEANDTYCKTEAVFLDTVVVEEQTYTTTNIIEVYEINPIANLYSLTQPTTGTVPYTVQLTPRGTVPGSFAIEKIDWDFGDGSPIQTVWRHQSPTSTLFTLTCTFSADLNDPRNYDAIYTYNRALNTYPVFYPSITAYSGNTNSSDACSIIIGPLSLSSVPSNIHILKNNYDNQSILYALQVGQNTSLVVTQTADSLLPFTSTKPANLIKPANTDTSVYKGYTGDNYPPVYNPTC